MKIEVAVGQPVDLPRWDEFIKDHPTGSPFLTSAWSRVVSTYGLQPILLLAKSSGSITGGLPLYLCRHLGPGRVLVSAPFCSWGSVSTEGRETASALVAEAIRLADELGVRYLELRGREAHQHPELQGARAGYINPTLTVEEPSRMWSSTLRGRARTAVRKARKSGLRVERGHALLEHFYEIMATSMRRLGTPVHAKRFYGAILSAFGDEADLLAAFIDKTPVAAYLLIRDQRTMFHLSAGSRPGYEKLNANSLLMWEALELAHRQGLRVFDFGRSNQRAGTLRFKRQWGCNEEKLHYQYYLPGAGALPEVDPTNPRYRLAIRTWGRMPLALTKLLGPSLISRIP